MVADPALDGDDLRLIEALQCDGRVTVEQTARVLGLPVRAVQRRMRVLLGDGVVRVVAVPPGALARGVVVLRIRVLRGKLDPITAALAAREDIPLVDVSAAGDEILALLLAGPDPRHRLVFRQLPATSAVTSVEAQTVMHVFSDATDWRLGVLSDAERAALGCGGQAAERPLDDLDRAVLRLLGEDLRLPAATIAARLGHPESTVRRRLSALRADGRFVTQAFVDPTRLGLTIDANLLMRVPPDLLDRAGRALARHPAVHGAMATTGASNLHAAVWLRDLEHLYAFITQDLAALGVTEVETVLIGASVKRPGKALSR
ncbi:Lrp/AsnC family transcriptional regulator [Amycolatopsis tucumanensis]|uniref:Lrp/AsnC family transcriptional regulator n=1 Tax=Amycolatopsis tucumanensis TaxID=401106 RepID=A0ABP7JIA8_9PSEU|nr:Lrp/AsnC family transcriptional regulator [Amycolatopsis tucumanensis]MCF6425188.1 Lrp/AsnC family transcriptional regulator [Amycolatopsis tucumanensis]